MGRRKRRRNDPVSVGASDPSCELTVYKLCRVARRGTEAQPRNWNGGLAPNTLFKV